MLPAMSCRSGYSRLICAHALEHVARVAVRRIDDDDVDARFDEQRDALVGVDAGADRRADAQRAALRPCTLTDSRALSGCPSR